VSALLVRVGGAVGAPARYLTDLWVQSRHDSKVPWGTFTVNVVGSLILGAVAGAGAAAGLSGWAVTLLGTGFCGALTTFSTFSYETVRLLDAGRWRTASLYVAASVIVGLAACALGWWVGTSL
jgi:CrcB protein